MTPEEIEKYEAVHVGPIPLLRVGFSGWQLLVHHSTKDPEKVFRELVNDELEAAAMQIFMYHHIIRKLGE